MLRNLYSPIQAHYSTRQKKWAYLCSMQKIYVMMKMSFDWMSVTKFSCAYDHEWKGEEETCAWGFWTSTPLDLCDLVHSTKGSWIKVSRTLIRVSLCVLSTESVISQTFKKMPSYPVIPKPSIMFCKSISRFQIQYKNLTRRTTWCEISVLNNPHLD